MGGSKADRPYGSFRLRAPMPPPTEPPTPPRPGRLARWRAALRRIDRRDAIVTLVVGLFALSLLNVVVNPAPIPLGVRQVDFIARLAIASATPRPNAAGSVYEALRPSVVSIRTRVGTLDGPEAQGSGVIISEAGDILTSLHVVAQAARITVIFSGGQQSVAGIVAQRPESDIAVIKAASPPQPLVPAVIGDANSLRVGDDVFAIGDPFGLSASLSAGVVSGLGRAITVPGRAQAIPNLIQFDAAVNPGSSGGPLVNRNGDVVGIVTGIAQTGPTGRDVFAGVGFATRIDTAAGAAGSPPY